MEYPNFHDRDGFIWFDGELIPWREANLHVLSHGLHYASSVFEGERAYNGKIFKLREHSQRLIDSASALEMDIPFSVEALDEATQKTVEANGLANCYVRPVAWKGSEQMGVINTQGNTHVAIATWPWDYISAEVWGKGLRLCEARYRKMSNECFPATVKAAGLYTVNTLNKNQAQRKGYDDALVLGSRGKIAESTSANIFLVIDGKLHTPIPDCFLNGITRQTVIKLAASEGIEVMERDIEPNELAAASEVFLTGTAVELTPVSQIDFEEKHFKFTVGGPVENRLIDAFRELTGMVAKAATV
jgi:branched-chain amino acid aminotransferase